MIRFTLEKIPENRLQESWGWIEENSKEVIASVQMHAL